MARSRDFDDDWDEPPRTKPKRRKKSRPNTGLLIALGAGLGLLILLLAGGVGFLVFGDVRASLPLGGVLPHPAHAVRVTENTFNQVDVLEPQSAVERKLGAGCPLTAAEIESIQVRITINARFGETGFISLKEFGHRPPGNAVITAWYQWGSGTTRLYIGFGRESNGTEPVLLAMCYQQELPGGTYSEMKKHAPITITFAPPNVGAPRK